LPFSLQTAAKTVLTILLFIFNFLQEKSISPPIYVVKNIKEKKDTST